MADHTDQPIMIGDCRIRLMRGGAGRPLLFLHGAGGAGIWLPCMARLAQKFDVIAPEHPGFGASDTPDWLDTIADLANFYLDFLDQLDLRGVHLVGSSLGGWIAAELAVRNTSRLASLTLVGAAGIHVNGVAAGRHVPAHRRAAHPRPVPRPGARRGDDREHRSARSWRTPRSRTATITAKLLVAAARPRSASAQMAAPDRGADAAGLGRRRPAVPAGLCLRLPAADPRLEGRGHSRNAGICRTWSSGDAFVAALEAFIDTA